MRRGHTAPIVPWPKPRAMPCPARLRHASSRQTPPCHARPSRVQSGGLCRLPPVPAPEIVREVSPPVLVQAGVAPQPNDGKQECLPGRCGPAEQGGSDDTGQDAQMHTRTPLTRTPPPRRHEVGAGDVDTATVTHGNDWFVRCDGVATQLAAMDHGCLSRRCFHWRTTSIQAASSSSGDACNP